MKQTGRCLPVVLLILLVFALDHIAHAEELKPHNVIVRTAFKEVSRTPVIKSHSFDLLTPEIMQEPYLPKFAFSGAHVPEDFPQNIEISGLTKFSPTLSRFFRGPAGQLENGAFFYQRHQLNQAEANLLPLITQSKIIREPAILYLAWIKYKEKLWKESLKLTGYITRSNNKHLASEATYLTALVYYKQQQYRKVITLSEQLKTRISLNSFSLKQKYIYLISLVKRGFWEEARQVSENVISGPIYHIKPYYKIVELSALIDYEQKSYTASLKKLLRVKRYNSHPAYQYAVNRQIAWLLYLGGNYSRALSILNAENIHYSNQYRDELQYLKLACLVRQKNWPAVKSTLGNLNGSSVFYPYSVFQIRSYLKNPKEHPNLFQQISNQVFNLLEMKFYVAILDGNLFFKQNRHQKAEAAFLKALSIDSRSPDYLVAQYNMGLTHLKLRQYQAAEIDFSDLLKIGFEKKVEQVRYHLAYSLYQQAKAAEALHIISALNTATFNRSQQAELLMMKAGSQLQVRKNKLASQTFSDIWSRFKNPESLEFIIQILYDQQQYKQVLELANQHPDHQSHTLRLYKIKSLLALRLFKEAQFAMDQISAEDEQVTELRLKVWAANEKYKQIIKYVSRLLNTSLLPQKRLYYYLSLGNAFFNLQQYRDSKIQFFRSLNLVEEPELKSLIYYNIALSSYYYGDHTSFLNEVNLVLQRKQIPDDIRYNLTLLLAEFYQKTNKIAQSDRIYREYEQKHAYNQTSIHIKRIRLWYQNQNFNKCSELSREKMVTENIYQRRDRLIMFGYCTNNIQRPVAVIKKIKTETEETSDTYRLNELHFILAQAYAGTAQYSRSLTLAKNLIKQSLNNVVRKDTQLLISHNLLKLKKPQKANIELGKIDQYRSTGQYTQSLHLLGEIQFQLKQYHKAHRTLLRIYYLPESTNADRHLALLRLSEGYLAERDLKSAQKHFKMIDPAAVGKEIGGTQRYTSLKKSLKKRHIKS